MNLSALIQERGLSFPETSKTSFEEDKSRWLSFFMNKEYGILPQAPSSLSFVPLGPDVEICHQTGILRQGCLTGTQENLSKPFSFPVQIAFPKGAKQVPYFVHISFMPHLFMTEADFDVIDETPVADVLAKGFGIIHVWYLGVTSDDNDFTNGIAPIAGPRTRTSCGKISLWAWAMSRCVDYAETCPEFRKNGAISIGHSRLGKTSLVAAANDLRFCGMISNDSGCAGVSPFLKKGGETLKQIQEKFPYWFREDFGTFNGREQDLDYDQQYLCASLAPRLLVIGSSEKDDWADPKGEKATCLLASKVYEALGVSGFVAPDEEPRVGDDWNEGNICYHMRAGVHRLMNEDWFSYLRACEKLK